MGNFAKNLNLGNRVLPPPPRQGWNNYNDLLWHSISTNFLWLLQGIQALDQIAIDIDSVAKDPINDIEAVIDSTGESIAEIYQNAEDQLNNVSNSI